MGHSIAPTQPAHYPSISNKRVIFFHTLMSEIVPYTIILRKLSLTPLLLRNAREVESRSASHGPQHRPHTACALIFFHTLMSEIVPDTIIGNCP